MVIAECIHDTPQVGMVPWQPQGPLMSVGFYRINKGGLHTLYSVLVRLTRNSHPFLFFSLEGRSFL